MLPRVAKAIAKILQVTSMIVIILQTVKATAKIANVASTTAMFPQVTKAMATIERHKPQKDIAVILCIAKGNYNAAAIS